MRLFTIGCVVFSLFAYAGETLIPELKKIVLEGSESAQELSAELEERFLNQPITAEDIAEMKTMIAGSFRIKKRPLVKVNVPEQEVTDGCLTLEVVESTLGNVEVTGNCWTSAERLKKYIDLKPDEPINDLSLVQNLDFINRNPFRRVDAIYCPGECPHTTDVELRTWDRFPLRVYAGIENTGLEDTGRTRWYSGFNWGNAFFLDHILSFQYTTTWGFKKFQAYTLHYTAPLSWKHTAVFYGGYSTVNAHLDTTTKSHGVSGQGSLRYEVPLPQGEGFLHENHFGFDFKRTNNTFEFVEQQPMIGSETNLTQLLYIYLLGYETRNTKTSFQLDLVGSPARWLPDQTKADFESLRYHANPQYFYFKGNLGEVIHLPKDFVLSLFLKGQYATSNLLPSEQIGIGGYDTVRGFEERQLSKDNGLIGSVEFRLPSINYFGRLTFLGFLDAGWGIDHDPFPGEHNSQYLIGVGPGARFFIDGHAYVRFDWGFNLHGNGPSNRVHFAATLDY